MSNAGTPEQPRYYCTFVGCGKSFQRREHLARHARSHSTTRYVCQVCKKEFTRSDSLQRHLGLHGEGYKPSASGRSKRACTVCHSNKLKCDGQRPCSRCLRKAIDCKYDQPEVGTHRPLSKGAAPWQIPPLLPRGINSEPSPLANITASASPASADAETEAKSSFADRLSAASKRNGGIDWSEVRLEGDLPTGAALSYGAFRGVLSDNEKSWPVFPELEVSKYQALYFSHFHYRWPIIHAPTFESEDSPPALLSCLTMIGACIHGTSDAKDRARSMHERVADWVLSHLCMSRPDQTIDQPETLTLCQVSLLFIIFGFYCGRETVLPKAIMVRGMLVSSLREIGLFNPQEPVSYDKPGYFMPLKLVKEGFKQRLSTCLFKIDTYLSILRNQPGTLLPEELHSTLPSTFAVWNCDGLNVFQVRHSIEPEVRGQKTICGTILESDLDSVLPEDGSMLAEDIQLGLCAMHSNIWRLLERTREMAGNEVSAAIEKDFLKQRLESWKKWLIKIPVGRTGQIDFSPEQHLAMRYYYGIEDHSLPGWQLIVFDRHKNLIFDTFVLYHLLSIHLDVDIRVLTQLAREKQLGEQSYFYGEINSTAQVRRESSTHAWAKSTSARRALCHAADILISYHNISGFESKHVDPIAYVALSVAALSVWAYCTFGSDGCADCNAAFQGGHVIELTKWSHQRASQVFEQDRDSWIEMGHCRGALAGIRLCRCNITLLVAKFRTCIREGYPWEAADTIAPGIFNL